MRSSSEVWIIVESVFDPLHARFNLTLEGCADDEGRNSYTDVPHFSPSDSILECGLIGDRVVLNPSWELAE
jgi:hypothetical protein